VLIEILSRHIFTWMLIKESHGKVCRCKFPYCTTTSYLALFASVQHNTVLWKVVFTYFLCLNLRTWFFFFLSFFFFAKITRIMWVNTVSRMQWRRWFQKLSLRVLPALTGPMDEVYTWWRCLLCRGIISHLCSFHRFSVDAVWSWNFLSKLSYTIP
jgi:hypothetical protein